MDRNLKIARDLIRLARTLVAGESFGDYAVELDKKSRTVTAYFYLPADGGVVESEAWRSALGCWKKIKSELERDGLMSVGDLENNDHKSFSFSVVVKPEAKTAARMRQADGDDDSGDDGGAAAISLDDSGDDGDSISLDDDSGDGDGDSGDSGDDGDSDDSEEEDDPKDMERYRKIRQSVIDICDKAGWNYTE